MSRVSKREQIAQLNEKGYISEKSTLVTYKVAIYARLSVEDTSAGKSKDTLSTQVYFIKKFIEDKPYLQLVSTFTDNGYSGTNFHRPGFDALMEEVKSGKINCIIVKDLSRFGRNYLETGKYLEYLFPFMGVRFIAINDDFDSSRPIDSNTQLSVSIKNLTNDRFAHDISNKINATFKTKWKNGEFVGSLAPHGYMKNPEDNHKLIVDEETAPVIKRIFEMRAAGNTYAEIADALNIERIESPASYKIRKGILTKKSERYSGIWVYTQVRKILLDPVYIGHMAQGKTSLSKFQNKKYIYNDKKDWVIVENTHDPIISQDIWDAVQKKFEETKAAYKQNHGKYQKKYKPSENILKGKIFCGDCGCFIGRAPKYYANGERYFQYTCNHKNIDGKCCPSKLMLEPKLYDLIYKAVRVQMNLCADYKKIVSDLERKNSFIHQSDVLSDNRKKLIDEKSIAVKRKAVLYDDYAEKIITREDYVMLTEKYDDEIERLSQHIGEIEEQIANRDVMVSSNNYWIIAFDRFRNQRKLSKEMVDLLISRIVVFSKDRIEIEFNFRDEFDKLCEGIGTAKSGGEEV